MGYPSLVRICKTPITVTLYSEEITEDGSVQIGAELDTLCNFQSGGKTYDTKEKHEVRLAGRAYFPGDIAPELAELSSGEAVIFGVTRRIISGEKARNPDGTVNYTRLDLV